MPKIIGSSNGWNFKIKKKNVWFKKITLSLLGTCTEFVDIPKIIYLVPNRKLDYIFIINGYIKKVKLSGIKGLILLLIVIFIYTKKNNKKSCTLFYSWLPMSNINSHCTLIVKLS